MAERNPGTTIDPLIYPGETIADILEEHNLSQKELALRTGVSEAFLCDVIHGKKTSNTKAKAMEKIRG